MTPEAKIVKQIQDRLKKLKASGWKVWWCKNHGSVYTKAGVPDLMIVWEGRPVFFEVKTPGGRATKIQEHVMQEIRDAGGIACVVTSADHVEWFFLESIGRSK